MICFPNSKINLGLNIIEKREDGFHNIETVFYPIGWKDALEVIEAKNSTQEFNLHVSGLSISGNIEDNLLYKTYQLIKKIKSLPPVEVYLHKVLPMGAGLGGGSADAAFFINLLNEQFSLKLTEGEKTKIAKQLGSDCAFFIKNKPVFAYEKGDVFKPVQLDLSSYFIAVVYPNIHSNTKDAYSLVKASKPSKSILDVLKQPIETWKEDLMNDFESSIFYKYPVVETTKNYLYEQSAMYASMSGSGSAIFGLFTKEPDLGKLSELPHWIGKLD